MLSGSDHAQAPLPALRTSPAGIPASDGVQPSCGRQIYESTDRRRRY